MHDSRFARASVQIRLFLKRLMYPGTNWWTRDKAILVRSFLVGSRDCAIRTLDCGCGNAYFSYQAWQRGATCVGITIHESELRKCEEMREYLEIPADRMRFVVSTLKDFSTDQTQHGRFDQILLLDVLEHILDDSTALTQMYRLLADDGFVFITVPNRDWQGFFSGPRVDRYEKGWHVRNGYTFEQLETLLEKNGLEPIDRLRFGTLGSTVVTAIQYRLFGSRRDELTVILFPLLKLIAFCLSPWKRCHTIFVLARKRRPKEGYDPPR
jgi:SAM-dependent methyltransferase